MVSEKELKNILKKKKVLFEVILNISELQGKWIEKDDWKRVINTINTKQDKIEKVNGLNRILKQMDLDESYLQNTELIDLKEQINETIYKIQQKEKENIQSIQSMMKDDKAALKNIQLKKTVNTAYLNTKKIQKDGYFIDRFK